MPLLLCRGAVARAESLRGYGSVGGSGFVMSELDGHREDTVPGWRAEFGVGPAVLPVMLGIGGGAYHLKGTRTEVERASSPPGGVTEYGYRIVSESLDLWHIELVLRLQPDWPRVRPFFSGGFGYAALWTRTAEPDPTRPPRVRPRRSGSTSFGDGAVIGSLALGLDIQPMPRGRWAALVLTLGVRASETGTLSSNVPEVPAGRFRIVGPFAAVTIAAWH